MWAVRACLTLVALIALTVCAIAQSVISTHSGLIYYFDGSVYLADQPLESHLGKFPSVPEGAELRTAQGHAEVLLAPGVFLRMGEKSSIRMLSNDLANARVELQVGSVIVDSTEGGSGNEVMLVFRDWQVRSAPPGVYRIDSDPARLWVLKGSAEVCMGTEARPVTVKQGMDLPFAAILVPEPSSGEPVDGLSDWAQGRSDSIAADNAITQQIDSDPASQTAGPAGFTYFPVLGASPNPYSSIFPTQPGFYSAYLPGYTSLPLVLVLRTTIVPRLHLPPVSIGIPRRIRPPMSNPFVPHPAARQPAAPSHPVATHSVPTAPHATPHVAHR
jgi:hypothetical protein